MIYSKEEELANTISHALGVLFGIFALPLLQHSLPVLVYSFSFIFLFLSSTCYHAVSNIELKKLLQKVDHVSIYFMIAGSYTPFIFACLNGKDAWIFFGIMWGIVVCGTIFKLFFTGQFEKLSLILYLSMGWMVIFIIKPFLNSFDSYTIWLVVIGGLSYTGGVYFYANDERKYYHFIWHLFVLGGAISHYLAIASL